MKILSYITIAILLLFLVSCSENETLNENSIQNVRAKSSQKQRVRGVSLSDCIHNALYYLDNTEINYYDSIDTHYFHEILGYTDEKALTMEKTLQILKNSLLIDTANSIGKPQRVEIEDDIDNLRYELYSYEKKVIGYVFIHTYSIKGDTLSAIILMTKNCSSSQAIPVNAIKDIDPSDYSYKIKQIESNI